MGNYSEGHHDFLDIRETRDQKPYFSKTEQLFLEKWFDINDTIQPVFLDREEWNFFKDSYGILNKISGERSQLFIPKDMAIWEMPEIMAAVDEDTFEHNPQKAQEKMREMEQLGRMFRNTAIYIAQRIDAIDEGKDIARYVSKEFYEYGALFLNGGLLNEAIVNDPYPDISGKELTPEEIEEVDRWLAGDKLYESRKNRVTSISDEVDRSEDVRKATLKQFFRVLAKAYDLQEADLPHSRQKLVGFDIKRKPLVRAATSFESVTPTHDAFVDKVKTKVQRAVETPKEEFENSALRRGMEMLKNDIGIGSIGTDLERMGIQVDKAGATLKEALKTEELKRQLDEAKATGDPQRISQVEKEIALKIQTAVSNYEYNVDSYNPKSAIDSEMLNCIGFSSLGCALQREVGLNCYMAGVPGHAITILVTETNQMYWQDMQAPNKNVEIEAGEILYKGGGKRTTAPTEIAMMLKDGTNGSVYTELNSYKFYDRTHWLKTDERTRFLVVHQPGTGEAAMMLNTLGSRETQIGHYGIALVALEKAYNLCPDNPQIAYNLACAHEYYGNKEEAVKYYRRAINIDGTYPYPYNGLGNIYLKNGQYEEALDLYRQGIDADETFIRNQFGIGSALAKLGRDEEAISALEVYTSAADPATDKSLIDEANKLIAQIKGLASVRKRIIEKSSGSAANP